MLAIVLLLAVLIPLSARSETITVEDASCVKAEVFQCALKVAAPLDTQQTCPPNLVLSLWGCVPPAQVPDMLADAVRTGQVRAASANAIELCQKLAPMTTADKCVKVINLPSAEQFNTFSKNFMTALELAFPKRAAPSERTPAPTTPKKEKK